MIPPNKLLEHVRRYLPVALAVLLMTNLSVLSARLKDGGGQAPKAEAAAPKAPKLDPPRAKDPRTGQPTRERGPRRVQTQQPRENRRGEKATCGALDDFNGDGIADLAVGAPTESLGGADAAGAVHVFYGARSGLSRGGSQFWTQNSPGVRDAAEDDDFFGDALLAADFDGDDRTDLAIGASLEDTPAVNAGQVHILYGTPNGLSAARNQVWFKGSAGVPEDPGVRERFGAALSSGDFNGDGYCDLVVSAPQEDYRRIGGVGSVTVLYGSASGLRAAGSKLWRQGLDGLADEPEPNDRFGSSLAAGDINRDGYDDLAVGAPFESVGGAMRAGAVSIIFGARSGLTATGNEVWSQSSPGIADTPGQDDQFGTSLAVGDVNGDGYGDLAAGAPGDAVDGKLHAGRLHLLFGTRSGLTAARSQALTQDTPGVDDTAEETDAFGHSVAMADFTGDRMAELVIGVPGETLPVGLNSSAEAGGVAHLMRGSRAGAIGTNSELWSQESPDVSDTAEISDHFGHAVVAGDFDGDGNTDLAVGVPGETLKDAQGCGATNVLYGDGDLLSAAGNQMLSQGSDGVPDKAEPRDGFGTSQS